MIQEAQLLSVRTQALQQFLAQGMYPEALLVTVKNGEIDQITMLPIQNDIKPSQYYEMRKALVRELISGSLAAQFGNPSEFMLCTYDSVHGIDFVYFVDRRTVQIRLSLYREGRALKTYPSFSLSYDERNDIANL